MLNSYLTNHIKLTTLVVIALFCAISQSTVEGRAARMSDFVGKGAHCISVKRDYPPLASSPVEQQQQEDEEEEDEENSFNAVKRNSYRQDRNSSRDGYGFGCDVNDDGYPCLLVDSCGKFDISARHKYIVGGKEALPGDVPSYVYIEHPTGAGSGVLISEWHVATAAHVIWGKDFTKIVIHAGSVLKPTLEDEDRQTRRIDQVCFPKDLVDIKWQANDFAIIKLASPFELGSFVKPACWPYEGRGEINIYGRNAQCYIAGLGAISYDSDGNPVEPNVLQKFRLKVVRCAPDVAHDRYMCFQSVPERSAIPCSGDSGTALLCSDKKGRFVVVGIFASTYYYPSLLSGNTCGPQNRDPIAISMYPDYKINRDALAECSGNEDFGH